MSFRKTFGRKNLGRRRNGLAVRAANHTLVAACVEVLEERALLTPVIPGLDQHGLVVGNAQVAGRTSYVLDGAANPGLSTQLSDNIQGSGLFINLNNASGQISSLKSIALRDITVANNGNAGIQINLSNITLDRLALNRALVTGNGGAGVVLNLTNARIGEIVIWDSNTPDTSDPLWFQSPNFGDSGFNDNVSDGIHFRGADSTIGTFRLFGNVALDNGRHGVMFGLNNVAVSNFILDDNELLNNGDATLNNGGGSGILFETDRTNLAGRITNNTVSDNLIHGFSFTAQSLIPGTSTPTAGTSNFDLSAFSGNLIEGNDGAGLSVELKEKTTWDATVQRNIISGNGRRGIDLRAADTENAFDILIGGLATNAQGQLTNGNTFEANVGAGIALELSDTSGNVANTTGRFRILGNTIAGTLDDPASTVFNGEGVYVRALGDVTKQNGAARFFSSVIDRNTVELNAGDGVRFSISEDSELVDLTIGNLTGPQLAFDVNGASPGGGNIVPRAGDGNVIRDNGGNGISVLRLASSIVENIRIFDNLITNNAEGVYLQASNTYQTVPNAARPNLKVVSGFDVRNNDVSTNRLNGFHLRTEFNAVLLANLYYNRIDGNALNGIRVTGLENNSTDFENVGGRWTKNAITANGIGLPAADQNGNGIRIENVVGSVNPLVIGRDGFDTDSQSFGNYIARNGSDGIEIGARAGGVGGGSTTVPVDVRDGLDIINNQIIENGRNGVGSPYLAGKGIDIEVLFGQPREFRIDRNIIQGNAGDGIEVLNSGGKLRLTAMGNFIDLNGGRGVDILNRADAQARADAEGTIVFGDANGGGLVNRNTVTRNGLEGVYVVNTVTGTQTQDVSSELTLLTYTMDGDGAGLTFANLVIDIENNEIRDNGLGFGSPGQPGYSPGSDLSGTGLVLRVGSQGSANSFGTVADISGYAGATSDAALAGVGTNKFDGGNSVSGGFSITANGRVNARVVNNEFSGNGGDDVLIEAFVSLLPRSTPGTWNETEITGVNFYDRDPLSRLNLVFTGNTGDSVDVVRGTGANDQQTYSFTNAEAEFKSRNQKTGTNPSGPFNDAGRDRLITRVADRSVGGQNGSLSSAFPDTYSGVGFTAPNFGPNVAASYSGPIGSIDATDPTGPIIVTAATRNGTITGASNENPSIITSPSHGLQTGDEIFISGAVGNTAINNGPQSYGQPAYWEVERLTANTFQLRNPVTNALVAGNAAYTANSATWTLSEGAVISAATNAAPVIITLGTGSFDFNDGDFVTISGAQGNTAINNGDFDNDPATAANPATWILDRVNFTFNQYQLLDPVTLQPVAGNGVYVAGSATLRKPSGSHGLSTGDVISITTNSFSHPANGVHVVEVLDGQTFALYVPNATPSSFFGGDAQPVLGNGTTLLGGTFIVHNPSKIQFDGTGPSTFRVETNQSVSGFTGNQLGDNFLSSAGVGNSPISMSWDRVAAGTFSFLSAWIGDVTVNEAAGTATLTVTLSENAPVGGVTLAYRTSDGSAKADPNNDGSTLDGDFVPVTSGSITVLAGTRTRTFTINIRNDATFEGTDQFYVDLFQISTGDFVDSRAVVTITPDGDPIPTITVGDVIVDEFTGQASVTISLSGASGDSVTVDYTTFDGVAKAGSDYVAKAGTVTFNPGQTSVVVPIIVAADALDETHETFGFRISNPIGGVITPNAQGEAIAVATATIRDTRYINVSDVQVNETAGTVTITVRLNEPLAVGATATVNWATASGTAISGSDFTAANGTLTFTGTETVKTFTITVASNVTQEGNEVFFVNLSGAAGAAIGKAVGRVTIVDPWEAESGATATTGRVDGDGWLGDPGLHGVGFLIRTPAITGVPAGAQFATFRLQVFNNTVDNANLAGLNVVDAATGRVLAQRFISRREFKVANAYQDFDLAFVNTAGTQLRFAVVFFDVDVLKVDGVRVSTAPSNPLVLEAEAMAHQTGRAEGDGWAADPALHSAGFLVQGPGATDVPVGRQTATFRLQVRNNNFDNAVVAGINVFDAATGRTLAQRVVRRTEFAAANVYQEFVLEFDNVVGSRLEFRVFWTGGPYLKADRVIVSRTPAAPLFKLEAEAPGAFANPAGGRRYGDGYGVDPALDTANQFLANGTPTTAVPAGSHVALFRLLTGGGAAPDAAVVSLAVIDVRDPGNPQALARRTLFGRDFAAAFEYQDFALAFASSAGASLSFRVFWPGDALNQGRAFVQLDHVAVVDAPSPQLLVEAESPTARRSGPPTTTVGQASADGFGWSATAGSDPAGYLAIFGPYGNNLVTAGAYAAAFRLRINDVTSDNAPIVTFEAYDRATDQTVRRSVFRREFAAANAFQEFTLSFSAVAEGDLELRVFWHGNANVELDYVRAQPSNFSAAELEPVFANIDELLLVS